MTIYLFREPAGIDTGWHECSRDAYEVHKGQAGFEVMVVSNNDIARQEVECRLWDTQWMNIVNHENCWRDYDKESAIADAVRLTEDAMARNFRDDKWPPRKPIQGTHP